MSYALASLAIPDSWGSPPTDRLGTSKCKAVAGTVARTAANKAMALTFLKRRHLPRNSALSLFSSVGKQTRVIANHSVTQRELFKTLKMDTQSNVRLSDSALSNVCSPCTPHLFLCSLSLIRIFMIIYDVLQHYYDNWCSPEI